MTQIKSDSKAAEVLKYISSHPSCNSREIVKNVLEGILGKWDSWKAPLQLESIRNRFAKLGWITINRSQKPMTFKITDLGKEAINEIEANGTYWSYIGKFRLPIKSSNPEMVQKFLSFLKEVEANPGLHFEDYPSSAGLELEGTYGEISEYFGFAMKIEKNVQFEFGICDKKTPIDSVSLTELGKELLKSVEA